MRRNGGTRLPLRNANLQSRLGADNENLISGTTERATRFEANCLVLGGIKCFRWDITSCMLVGDRGWYSRLGDYEGQSSDIHLRDEKMKVYVIGQKVLYLRALVSEMLKAFCRIANGPVKGYP